MYEDYYNKKKSLSSKTFMVIFHTITHKRKRKRPVELPTTRPKECVLKKMTQLCIKTILWQTPIPVNHQTMEKKYLKFF